MADAQEELGGNGNRSGPGYFLDADVMHAQIARLRTAADRFDSIPNNRRNTPDAGPSTGEVGEVLASLIVAAAALGDTLSHIAETADVSADSYATVDNESADRLSG